MKKYIYRFIWENWRSSNGLTRILFLVSFGLFLLSTMLRIMTPIVFAYLVTIINPVEHWTIIVCMSYATIFFLLRFNEELRLSCYVVFEQFLQRNLYAMVQESYFSLPFHEVRKKMPSEYSVIIDRGMGGIRSTLYNGVFALFPISIEAILLVVICGMKAGLPLAIFIFLLLSIFIIITVNLSKKVDELNQKWYQSASSNYKVMAEHIRSFELIRSFNKKSWAKQRYDQALLVFIRQVRDSLKPNLLLGLIQGVLLFLLIAIATFQVIHLNIENKIAMLVLVNGLIIQITLPLLQFSVNYKMLINGISSSRQLFDFLSIPKADNKISHTTDLTAQGFKTENLSIHYDEQVIRYKNLHLPSSAISLIEGVSGSGKTSLAKALAGLIAYQGSILTEQRMEDIYYLSQQVDIFDLSLDENVSMQAQYDPALLADSLKLAGFTDSECQSLSNRTLGEQGVGISGGQAQRIGIARMIYHGARVMIFDEPTTGLDSQAAMTVISSLQNAAQGKTCVVISHDPRVREIADHIITL
ncbi:ATP-binding cassette domain-containing protein [Acinetobacter sp. WZC-1]|uniref:ATP-binding cassette domain-containing protein n=1 Tax=Acinetobacter sp. WZC-1 TaxID=3459034 RepID=UPI00403D8B69